MHWWTSSCPNSSETFSAVVCTSALDVVGTLPRASARISTTRARRRGRPRSSGPAASLVVRCPRPRRRGSGRCIAARPWAPGRCATGRCSGGSAYSGRSRTPVRGVLFARLIAWGKTFSTCGLQGAAGTSIRELVEISLALGRYLSLHVRPADPLDRDEVFVDAQDNALRDGRRR